MVISSFRLSVAYTRRYKPPLQSAHPKIAVLKLTFQDNPKPL
jgi:hypothetical protein